MVVATDVLLAVEGVSLANRETWTVVAWASEGLIVEGSPGRRNLPGNYLRDMWNWRTRPRPMASRETPCRSPKLRSESIRARCPHTSG